MALKRWISPLAALAIASCSLMPERLAREPAAEDGPAEATPVSAAEDPLAQACLDLEAIWLGLYRECQTTNASLTGQLERWCEAEGGAFDGCASACRHRDPPPGACIQVCVQVCAFPDEG